MSEKSEKSVLLTTAISYTNGSPHIGHLYESILADFIKRVYQK
jgi:methionyl-tRNA synthetase